MGQKTNPIILRIGITRMWESSWFVRSKEEFCTFLYQDFILRKVLKKHLKKAGVARIVIERPHKKCHITIHAARPGYVIGRKGEDIEKLKKIATKIVGSEVQINIVEVRAPQMDPILIAEEVAQSLEKRLPPKRLMKKHVQGARRAGARGVCIVCSGRFGGAEIARSEEYAEGPMPLHKLRADIHYGFAQAMTTYGVCGVKVWVYKDDIIEAQPLITDRRRYHQDSERSGGHGGEHHDSQESEGLRGEDKENAAA